MQANYTDLATATGRRILVPTFADRRVPHGQWRRNSRPLISIFWTAAAIFSFKKPLNYHHKAEKIPFLTT
jgi:hypothetical protein